jgi:hypothetical protein
MEATYGMLPKLWIVEVLLNISMTLWLMCHFLNEHIKVTIGACKDVMRKNTF